MATRGATGLDDRRLIGVAALPARPSAVRQGEIETLTAARGIAALAVLFYHIRASLPDALDPLQPILAKGYLAVDFFFLLSGFVLWRRYGEGGEIRDLRSARAFLTDRVLRLYPLHLAVLLAMVGFAGLVAVKGGATADRYPVGELPAHILLVQDWGFSRALAWNDPAWSISAEWGANLLFAVFCLWRAGRRWLAAHPVRVTAALLALLPLWFALRGEATLGENIDGSGLVRCLFAFGAGLGLAGAFALARDGACHIALAGVALTGGAGAATGLLPLEPAVAPAALAAALLALARSDGAPMARALARPFVPLGRISYSLYLNQFFGWTVFKLLFVDDPATVHPLLIALFVASILATSVVSHRLIEQRLRLWLGKRLAS